MVAAPNDTGSTARNDTSAYRDALNQFIDTAVVGNTQQVQDMVIGFAQFPARGRYVLNAENDLEWDTPDNTNTYIAVAVMDADDHRFLPYLEVQATFFDDTDVEHGPFDAPFIWHPYLYHYGRNIRLPSDGTYDLRIHVNPPTFDRADRERGDRYTHPIEVVFQNVSIQTGQV